jgi:putative FmdB family regulatory protein
MPLHDFDCLKCDLRMEGVLIRNDDDLKELRCPACNDGSHLQKAMSAHGGYKIKGDNGASQRPRRAGSFGGKK